MALDSINPEHIWFELRREVESRAEAEPVLSSFFYNSILQFSSMAEALTEQIILKLDHPALPAQSLRVQLAETFSDDETLNSICCDLAAFMEKDPACRYWSTPFLFYKGYQALQAWRVANHQWLRERHSLALFIHNRLTEIFDVDIHPQAKMGKGIMLDHATGIVVGETAVVEDDVSFYQGVTLGWIGGARGDRHPKVRKGALLGANATVLGPIEVGQNSRVGANSVVVADVPPRVTVAGSPAKIVAEHGEEPWWHE